MCEALRELMKDEIEKELENKLEQGEKLQLIRQVIKKLQKGNSVEETSDMLEEEPENIRKIYEIAATMPSSFLIKYPKTACVINSTQPKIIKFLPCLWFHSVTFVSSSLRSGFSPVFIDTGFSDLYCIIPSMIKISETNNEITK